LHKKFIPVIIFLFCAGIIALTQETDEISVDQTEIVSSNENNEELSSDLETKENLDFERKTRWFRSNAGGLAVEEMYSRYAALRNEFALAIDIAHHDEIPEYILSFYKDGLIPEIRILFKNSEIYRTQWILKDIDGRTRVNAVFLDEEESEQSTENSEQINESGEKEDDFLEIVDLYFKEGFVEVYDEKSFLISEYRFFKSGNRNKIEYEYNKNLIIISTVMDWQGESKDYHTAYKDFFYYNRSLSLRTIERIFYKEMQIDDDTLKIIFPRRIMDALNDPFIEEQKLNIYPEFFGEIIVYAENKIVYENDDRGRTLKQTLYNDKKEVVWVIVNIWSNDRIVSAIKTEGDNIFIAEYEYDSKGERILERNLRNGNLERIVHTNNKTDIEELYFNNILVLRAVWEDGRKISETRIR